MTYLIFGLALLLIVLALLRRKPPRAVVSSYDAFGETSWRWTAAWEGRDGYADRAAATQAAEEQGYFVEE